MSRSTWPSYLFFESVASPPETERCGRSIDAGVDPLTHLAANLRVLAVGVKSLADNRGGGARSVTSRTHRERTRGAWRGMKVGYVSCR